MVVRHQRVNETYMLFFQISSSEFTFSFTRKWILIVSYFPFPFVNSTFCFCDKIWISPWHTKIETKASCNIYVSSNICSLIQQFSLELTLIVKKVSRKSWSNFLNIMKFFQAICILHLLEKQEIEVAIFYMLYVWFKNAWC